MATLTPLAKKLFKYLALAIGCYVLFQYGFQSHVDDHSSSKHWSSLINDPRLQLRGLLYVLKTYPERTLPEVEDGALLTPYALGLEGPISPRSWREKVINSEYETPLVVFSKTYCPHSRATKALLNLYDLDPPPHIIEVDLRNDSMRIKSYLTRLTGRGTFPNVILRAQPIGGNDDMQRAHSERKLASILADGGVTARGDGVSH